MRLSELKNKEIIDVTEGRRLGRIAECEVSFDKVSGRLCELMIPNDSMGLHIFGKREVKRIAWTDIQKISDDFVLVGQASDTIPFARA